ncbi:putative E3 ubiquitin-protein ligase RING1a isoform X2 [Arachis stenosperma]|uniref:putative E3 ubiquitin-protein ligase RING1a isoform X2 n=1 Tax=Arachis stenosperma TaxID=217475 RepID=UPI0025AD6FE8|nr:putative E3 ubiquitin-protein ligase RING1a isoform X2 [Arachis stenosperma]
MPAQKRPYPDTLDDADDSSNHLFPHRHPKHHRDRTLKPHHPDEDAAGAHKEEDEQEQEQGDAEQEDEEDEQQGAEEEDDDEEEEEEEDDDEDEDEGEGDEEDEEEGKHNDEDSDDTPSSDSEEKPEFVFVELLEIRKDVQCPICLGIIKKTRTVMECLHRFCRECIDKSMRLGNNECPACRTHCASRRSLRDDPKYDALIAALYPDIEKYEEEELEFREEEKNRNKQIQASIAKVVQRQSEALVKRRKDSPSVFVTRSQRNQRNASRRQNQVIDIQGSEDNEEENDNNEKDSSSADERGTEARQRRRKRWTRVRTSQPSSSMASPDGGCAESDLDNGRENRGLSRQVSKPRKLTWGRGGFRSHTRHGSGSGSISKSYRSSRVSKMVDFLRNLDENADELDIHLMLYSLGKRGAPSLEKPHLCCRPTLSVKNLCEYVARQTPVPVEEVEILAVKGCSGTEFDKSTDETSSLICDELTTLVIDPSKYELEILQGDESLAGIRSKCISKREHLILAYRRKGV